MRKLADIIDGLSALDDFGVGFLTIADAAQLIVIDMWYSGDISNAALESTVEPEKSRIVEILSPVVKEWENRLAKAVAAGNLETVKIRRDFAENIIVDGTYVADGVLFSWLEQRGYYPGDYWHDDYYTIRDDIYNYLAYESGRLQYAAMTDMDIFRSIIRSHTILMDSEEVPAGTNNFLKLLNSWTQITLQNESLRERLSNIDNASGDSPKLQTATEMPTRTRRTMLIIIGALCQLAGIEPKGRGSAGKITRAIDRLGVSVSDDTVKRFLDEIPEAIEARTK